VPLELPAFTKLAAALRAASGLNLPRGEIAFIEARLQPAVRRLELPDAQTLIHLLAASQDAALTQAVFECLSAGETSFFRDKVPFEQLGREVLPTLAAARRDNRVKVWCAGCSTGQEAYSVALAADWMRGEGQAGAVEIVGTDLSERRLEKAASGLYTHFEVQRGLPIRMLVEWFDQVDEMWRVSPRLRQAVEWRPANLLDEPEPGKVFDLILCRNVLSEFDEDIRRVVLERLSRALAEDGRLLLGHSETVHGLTDAFRPAPGRRGWYVRNPEASRRVA
jgi:chemotaxis protein methyltransferase CheR